MEPQQLSGPKVSRPTTDTLSRRNTLYPLQGECMLTPKNKAPVTKCTPNVSLKDVPSATPRSGQQKKTPTTWRRGVSLGPLITLQETNNLFPKEMKNVTIPRVQKVPIITKRTTLLLIQNYQCHLPKSHVHHIPRNQLEMLSNLNVHVHDTLWDTSAQFQEGPKYSTLQKMGKLKWDCRPTWNSLKGR